MRNLERGRREACTSGARARWMQSRKREEPTDRPTDRSFVRSLVHFVCSFVRSLTRSFVRSFARSLAVVHYWHYRTLRSRNLLGARVGVAARGTVAARLATYEYAASRARVTYATHVCAYSLNIADRGCKESEGY